MVGVKDQQALIKELQTLRQAGPPKLPKFKGYGDGGQQRMFNVGKSAIEVPATI
jgi:hypothetical protein